MNVLALLSLITLAFLASWRLRIFGLGLTDGPTLWLSHLRGRDSGHQGRKEAGTSHAPVLTLP